jgi:hypothetical protein
VVTAFPTVKLGDDSQRPPAKEESQLSQFHFSFLFYEFSFCVASITTAYC